MAGRQSKSNISSERRAALDAGEIEAATLTECLAVDFTALLPRVVPDMDPNAIDRMRDASALGITRRMALAADLLIRHSGGVSVTRLQAHPSDTVRGWAAYMAGARPNLSLAQKIAAIAPFADDGHFGVREWAWLAVRPDIAGDIHTAIEILTPWTVSDSANLRRFATEATRPRGVWCAHIGALKQDPEPGRPLLEALKADPARYVQDSVGNWLNDASKDRPDWVRTLCARWSVEEPSRETARIIGRGLRTLTRS